MATAHEYTAHKWEDGEVITAERLNAIENQLAALSAAGAIGTGKKVMKATDAAAARTAIGAAAAASE